MVDRVIKYVVWIDDNDLIDLVLGVVEHTVDCVYASVGIEQSVVGVDGNPVRYRYELLGFFIKFCQLGAEEFEVVPSLPVIAGYFGIRKVRTGDMIGGPVGIGLVACAVMEQFGYYVFIIT